MKRVLKDLLFSFSFSLLFEEKVKIGGFKHPNSTWACPIKTPILTRNKLARFSGTDITLNPVITLIYITLI